MFFFILAVIQANYGSWNAVLYYLVSVLILAGVMDIITCKIFPVEVKLSNCCRNTISK